MKLLLDECVTRLIKRDLAGHEVQTVEEAGFKGLENGELLKAAAGAYEVLVSDDQMVGELFLGTSSCSFVQPP